MLAKHSFLTNIRDCAIQQVLDRARYLQGVSHQRRRSQIPKAREARQERCGRKWTGTLHLPLANLQGRPSPANH